MKTIMVLILALISIGASATEVQVSEKDPCVTVAEQFAINPFEMKIPELVKYERCTFTTLNKVVSAGNKASAVVAPAGLFEFDTDRCVNLSKTYTPAGENMNVGQINDLRDCVAYMREVRQEEAISKRHQDAYDRLYGVK